MKINRLKKIIKEYIIPPGIIKFLRLAHANNDFRKYSLLLTPNRKFQNIHFGESCFIVCNGPSIKSQDLKALKNQNVISVSGGYNHSDFKVYAPKYHCIPQLSIGSTTNINHISSETATQWLKEVHEKIGAAELFHSVLDASFIARNQLYRGRNVNYLSMTDSFSGNKNQAIDLTCNLPSVTTVPIMAIMIALYMGFKEIYLLGVEHDSYKSQVYNYFYEASLHYAGGGIAATGIVDIPLAELLLTHHHVFMQYRALLAIAQNKGVEIYNATLGGALEELPRVELEEVLNRISKFTLPSKDLR